MIGGKRHDLIPSIILLADTIAILIMEFQVQKKTLLVFAYEWIFSERPIYILDGIMALKKWKTSLFSRFVMVAFQKILKHLEK